MYRISYTLVLLAARDTTYTTPSFVQCRQWKMKLKANRLKQFLMEEQLSRI